MMKKYAHSVAVPSIREIHEKTKPSAKYKREFIFFVGMSGVEFRFFISTSRRISKCAAYKIRFPSRRETEKGWNLTMKEHLGRFFTWKNVWEIIWKWWMISKKTWKVRRFFFHLKNSYQDERERSIKNENCAKVINRYKQGLDGCAFGYPAHPFCECPSCALQRIKSRYIFSITFFHVLVSLFVEIYFKPSYAWSVFFLYLSLMNSTVNSGNKKFCILIFLLIFFFPREFFVRLFFLVSKEICSSCFAWNYWINTQDRIICFLKSSAGNLTRIYKVFLFFLQSGMKSLENGMAELNLFIYGNSFSA